MTVYFGAKDAANGHRPNWPDNDPRWLRATYDELIRLRAMLERTVVYKPVTVSPEDQQTDRNVREVKKSIDQLKGFGEAMAYMLLGACVMLGIVALVVPFLR